MWTDENRSPLGWQQQSSFDGIIKARITRLSLKQGSCQDAGVQRIVIISVLHMTLSKPWAKYSRVRHGHSWACPQQILWVYHRVGDPGGDTGSWSRKAAAELLSRKNMTWKSNALHKIRGTRIYPSSLCVSSSRLQTVACRKCYQDCALPEGTTIVPLKKRGKQYIWGKKGWKKTYFTVPETVFVALFLPTPRPLATVSKCWRVTRLYLYF